MEKGRQGAVGEGGREECSVLMLDFCGSIFTILKYTSVSV
jgi:hypothetical protein